MIFSDLIFSIHFSFWYSIFCFLVVFISELFSSTFALLFFEHDCSDQIYVYTLFTALSFKAAISLASTFLYLLSKKVRSSYVNLNWVLFKFITASGHLQCFVSGRTHNVPPLLDECLWLQGKILCLYNFLEPRIQIQREKIHNNAIVRITDIEFFCRAVFWCSVINDTTEGPNFLKENLNGTRYAALENELTALLNNLPLNLHHLIQFQHNACGKLDTRWIGNN